MKLEEGNACSLKENVLEEMLQALLPFDDVSVLCAFKHFSDLLQNLLCILNSCNIFLNMFVESKMAALTCISSVCLGRGSILKVGIHERLDRKHNCNLGTNFFYWFQLSFWSNKMRSIRVDWTFSV